MLTIKTIVITLLIKFILQRKRKIKLIIDEFNTHNDLLLNVPMWNLKTTFDTYYLHFLIFDPSKNTDSNIIRLRRKVVSNSVVNEKT